MLVLINKCYIYCLLFSLLTLISGCYDSEDIDRRMIVSPIGIDSNPDDKMLVTFRMLLVTPTDNGSSKDTGQGGKNFIVRSSLASGVFPALNDIQTRDEHSIFIGQCRAIIFGEGIAKKGLNPSLDFFNRMPTFPPSSFVVIGRPTAEAIQNINWPETEMHDQNIRWFFSSLPNQKFGVKKWELFRDIHDPLQDPLIPLVTPQDNNQTMKLVGMAVFREDRMIDELNLEEATLFQLLRNPGKANRISLSMEQNIHATFHAITGKKKIKVYYHNNRPSYKINIRLTAFLGELSGSESPLTKKDLRMLEKQTAKYLEKSLMKTLKRLQAMKSDPLGLGNYFRAKQPKHFSIEKWILDYGKAEFDVNVKLFIERLGVLK